MRRPHVILLAALCPLLLTACTTSPVLGPTSAPPPITGSASATVTPSPTPTPTIAPIALPTACESLYSADMIAVLNQTLPPLNDPGLADLLSTENLAGLDVLGSGVPSLRCTWGAPGSPGLATTVATVDGSDSGDVQASLSQSGFSCEPLDGGTVCTFTQGTVDQDDNIRNNGETHWFGAGLWIATHWVDVYPDEYTTDIVEQLTL